MASLSAMSRDAGTWRASCSLSLMGSVIEMRNGPEEAQGCLERTFRVLAAEISFLLVALVSLVEAVFRACFTIPGIIATSVCCLEGNARGLIEEITIAGPTISFVNVWVALAALIQNLCPGRLEYHEILPCTQRVFEAIPHLCDCCFYNED